MEEGHGVRESCGAAEEGLEQVDQAQYTVCRVGVVPTMIEQSTIRGTVDRLEDLITMLPTDNDGQEGKVCKDGTE